MTIRFTCGGCDRQLVTKIETLGKQVKCPHCATVSFVSVPSEPPRQPPADKWWLKTREGKEYGPLERADLERCLNNGLLDAQCQVLQFGSRQWQWVSDIYPQLSLQATVPHTPPAFSARMPLVTDVLLGEPSATISRTGPPPLRTDVRIPPRVKPSVCSWYIAFCMSMVFVHALLFAQQAMMCSQQDLSATAEFRVLLGYLVTLTLGGLYLAGAMMRAGRSSWVLGLSLLVWSCLYIPCIPLVIPLLVAWVMPSTRTYFGMGRCQKHMTSNLSSVELKGWPASGIAVIDLQWTPRSN